VSRDCFNILKEGAGDFFEKENLEDIFGRLKNAQAEAADNASDLHNKLVNAGDSIFEDESLRKDLKEFSFYRNIEIKNQMLRLVGRFEGRENGLRDALISYIDGTQKGLEGSRDSLELRIRTLESELLDRFKTDLKKNNLLEKWNSKDREVEIANSIKDNSHPEEDIDTIGKMVNDLFSQTNELYKKNGIFIQELEDRITRNFHNKQKMTNSSDSFLERQKDRKNLSQKERFEKAFQRWFKFTNPLLDKEKTFGEVNKDDEAEQERIMKKIFNTLTNGGNIYDEPKSMQQLLTSKRALHWKDGESKVNYNREYGVGTIHRAVESEFRRSARQIASLERLGINKNQMLKDVIKSAEKEFPDMSKKFNKKDDFNKIKRILDTATGSLEDPDSSAATIGGNLRAAMNIAKLGGVVISSLPDLAAITIENKRIYGGFVKSALGTIQGLVRAKSDADKAIFGDLLKSYTLSEVGNNTRWFTAEDAGVGVMSKLQSLSFKLNGLHWWDKGNRISIAVANARHLAINKDLSFADMVERDKKFGEENVRILKLYNLTGPEWDLIRKQPLRMADSKGYIVPDSVDDISDKDIKLLLNQEGRRRVSDSDIDNRRSDIKTKLGAYFQDRVDHGILRPSAKDRDIWFQGTRSGTWIGQVMRMMAQFKLYGTTFISKPLGRLVYGQGAESFWQGMLSGQSDRKGLVQLMAYGTVLGYLSATASNFTKGVSPPDPEKIDTLLDAFSRGGGLGMYSDLLLSNHGQFGESTLAQLAGPSIGEINNLITLATDPIHGQFSTQQAFNFVKGNTPLINTFYAKYPIDYLLLNRIQEAINPGYFRRKTQELRKEGQTYIFPPL